jgi:uncharacterized protein YhaN
MRQKEEELRSARRERDSLALAFQWVRQAAEQFQSAYREDLEQRLSERFRDLTGVLDRRVALDESFALSVIEADGASLAPPQLSQGARDQLLLSIRLAVADLLADSVPLPLFLDDPFVHYDAERLGRLREAMGRLAEERQWVLLTHRQDLAAWAEPVQREEREESGI